MYGRDESARRIGYINIPYMQFMSFADKSCRSRNSITFCHRLDVIAADTYATHILSGHKANDPTPATFSANANEAPPLRKPKGWRLRSSTVIVALHISFSGVETKSIPKAVDRFGRRSISRFTASTFIGAPVVLFKEHIITCRKNGKYYDKEDCLHKTTRNFLEYKNAYNERNNTKNIISKIFHFQTTLELCIRSSWNTAILSKTI